MFIPCVKTNVHIYEWIIQLYFQNGDSFYNMHIYEWQGRVARALKPLAKIIIVSIICTKYRAQDGQFSPIRIYLLTLTNRVLIIIIIITIKWTWYSA